MSSLTTVHIYAETSFGNMGFSKPICGKDIVDWEDSTPHVDLNFQCEGTTIITDVNDSGVLLSTSLPDGTDNVLTVCDTKNLKPDSFSQKLNLDYFSKQKFKKVLLN